MEEVVGSNPRGGQNFLHGKLSKINPLVLKSHIWKNKQCLNSNSNSIYKLEVSPKTHLLKETLYKSVAEEERIWVSRRGGLLQIVERRVQTATVQSVMDRRPSSRSCGTSFRFQFEDSLKILNSQCLSLYFYN